MNATVDLRQLAVHRGEGTPLPRRSRHLVSRYLLPGLVLAGFLAVLAWAGRDSFLPARPVTVVPVVTTRAEIHHSGAPLFVAAGWIEARPTPVQVPALAEGVVEKLLVVEGQEVKAGEPVAQLVEADARLALAAAEANLRQREAEADAILAKAETDVLYLPFQLKAAESQERQLRLDLESKKAAGRGSVSEIALVLAESELTMAGNRTSELRLRLQRLQQEIATIEHMTAAFRKGQPWQPVRPQLLTDVVANMKAAMTRILQEQVAVDMARLRLERMTVRAPQAGRVLGLLARPGTRIMLGNSVGQAHEAGSVVSLYDPRLLQVRADIRFEDLPNLLPGQLVRIESPAVPGGALQGEVLFATAIADIQKNTLQAKVAITDPPPVLKPDMLVQLTFLAPERPEAKGTISETLRLLVPRQLVETGEGGSRVWVADQVQRVARARSVKLGRAASAELVEVTEGLSAADKLIAGGREGLTDGQRIAVTGEDATLGVIAVGGPKANRVERLPGAEHQGKH